MNVNDVMEELEEETKYIMGDGKPVTIRTVIDTILSDEKKKKRELSTG